jgi:hypothetical protein
VGLPYRGCHCARYAIESCARGYFRITVSCVSEHFLKPTISLFFKAETFHSVVELKFFIQIRFSMGINFRPDLAEILILNQKAYLDSNPCFKKILLNFTFFWLRGSSPSTIDKETHSNPFNL